MNDIMVIACTAEISTEVTGWLLFYTHRFMHKQVIDLQQWRWSSPVQSFMHNCL